MSQIQDKTTEVGTIDGQKSMYQLVYSEAHRLLERLASQGNLNGDPSHLADRIAKFARNILGIYENKDQAQLSNAR